MGSVASVNPGVADLLQTLTNLNSPVMSSQTVVSALEKSPPADIVQLSVAATQLENMDAMFGISNGAGTDGGGILGSLESSLTAAAGAAGNGTSSSTILSTASPADRLANYEAALQSGETQGLFGTGTDSGLSGSLFSVIG